MIEKKKATQKILMKEKTAKWLRVIRNKTVTGPRVTKRKTSEIRPIVIR